MDEVIIEELSYRSLKDAVKLLSECFPNDNGYKIWFPKSLEFDKHREEYMGKGTLYVKYFLAIDKKSGKVLGTTGLYILKEDANEKACWVGWFAVSKRYRNKKIGSKLLDFTIDLARKKDMKFLRLWTTSAPNERKAQRLYDKRGFKEFKREKKNSEKYNTIYKQLVLKSKTRCATSP